MPAREKVMPKATASDVHPVEALWAEMDRECERHRAEMAKLAGLVQQELRRPADMARQARLRAARQARCRHESTRFFHGDESYEECIDCGKRLRDLRDRDPKE